MKRIFSTLLLLIICTTFFAQNLEKMNENERVNTLLRIAKEGVIKYGPDYYREYGKPEIKYNCVVDSNKNFADEDIEKYRNKYYYSVKYNYDKSKESFNTDYSAWVFIWANTGKVFKIYFGNGFGLRELDVPETIADSKEIKQMIWEKQPPRKSPVKHVIEK